nr:MAG TPA_asm: hypothetical protein [Caudoviricetes sp.]
MGIPTARVVRITATNKCCIYILQHSIVLFKSGRGSKISGTFFIGQRPGASCAKMAKSKG